jgi:hypothetical protein
VLLDGVVFHGVVAVLIILLILAIIVFGIIGLLKAIGRGARGVGRRASGHGPGR